MDDEEQLLQAAFKGDEAFVRQMIERRPELAKMVGRDDRWEGGTPLTLAAYSGHLSIIQFLLDRGGDVNSRCDDGSALAMAAYAGREQAVKLFIERGADPNITSGVGETSLMYAALFGFAAIGRMLIDAGADVNARTTSGASNMFKETPPVVGETALHLAAAYGHREFVELLLQHSARKDITDRAGQTPLHWAVRYRRDELIVLLK